MTDVPTDASELVTGRFRLVTERSAIIQAYEDDREVTVICDTGNAHQKFKAVFRLSDLPFMGYRGHTTDPAGFSVHYDGEGEEAWIEIARR